jgi:type IV secretory pathway TraG/TraD family ATPase VirD4
MRKRIIDAISFTGIWTCPITYFLIFECFNELYKRSIIITPLLERAILMLGLLPMMWIAYVNILSYEKDDKRCFNLGEGFISEMSHEKRKATYPLIPTKLLVDKHKFNDGFILGTKDKRHYVSYPIETNSLPNTIIIGSTGSGKTSSFYINNLVTMLNQSQSQTTIYAIDVKGELHETCVSQSDKNVMVVSFDKDKQSDEFYGWDVYYNLNAQSDENQRLEVFNTIASAIIISTSDKDGFWVENSRTLFVGLLSYYYDKHFDFIQSVSEILKNDISTLIEEIIETSLPETISYRWLYKYYKKSNSSFEDIITTMTSSLSVFNLPVVKSILSTKENKASPKVFDEGKSIFLNIPDYLLESLNPAFRLITTEVFEYVERRKSDNPLIMLLDEFPALGCISKITHYMSILRYHNCSIWLSIQSYYQLQKHYSVPDAKIILDNTKIKCILEISDTDTAKMVSDWCGFYQEKKKSTNSKGGHSSTTERLPIVTATDLITLSKKEETILVISGIGYLRVKRASYFKDSYIMDIIRKIHAEKEDD